jgi:hypothetical protein
MQLTWPDELKPHLERQAELAGCASVDEFTLRVFLQANPSAAGDSGTAIIDAAGLNPDDLEREIQAGLESGEARPMTSNDWADLRQRVAERLEKSASR